MSEKFNGFSQDEINKVSGVAKAKNSHGPIIEPQKQAFRGQHGGIRRMPEKWLRSAETLRKQQVGSQPAAPSGGAETTNKPTTIKTPMPAPMEKGDLDLERSLSKSLEEALFCEPIKKPAESTNGHSANTPNDASAASTSTDADDSSILKLPAMDNNVSSTSTATTDDSSILKFEKPVVTAFAPTVGTLNTDSPFKGVSLREFEVHRKMIEEQNKQKKELLCKAIEHHSQKTAAEARKIADIKCELSKLDNDLALDVSILRKQIDNACINFAQVEKQYMKIEGQFLKAKIDLHNAAEKKELLTEHLCTVIAHNEDRKAQKLAELMEKVGLTETGEYILASAPTQNVDK